jgi:S-adenosylhomocysteine hydrolase
LESFPEVVLVSNHRVPTSSGLSRTSGPFVQLAYIARGTKVLLKKKNAVIYGAGGAVGGAVARTFAREGANVFLAGRMLEPIDTVAKEIAADGGGVQSL